MILYLDTSALAKQYIREPESPQVVAWVAAADLVGASLIARPEMAAVLGRLRHMRALDEAAARSTLDAFYDRWPAYVRLPLNEATANRAGELAWEHGLRGYDAVHLATAILWQVGLGDPVTFATYDRRLGDAARKVGLVVVPA